ncbi:hypothetical protein [Streptomyces sp. SCSIO ZS0520]|uniref:hypothetical protein n=1 Tax=Streptomyces sp. SCSIO ZS0520 TaxID=2892996 RepID=UPI0021DA0F76|nr:hypothetical protein [Streptomyces sp. SCSIO ZS0520]
MTDTPQPRVLVARALAAATGDRVPAREFLADADTALRLPVHQLALLLREVADGIDPQTGEESVERLRVELTHARESWLHEQKMTAHYREASQREARALGESWDAEKELRAENERLRHELEVMYGAAFDSPPAAVEAQQAEPRPTASTITDPQLDALYAERARLARALDLNSRRLEEVLADRERERAVMAQQQRDLTALRGRAARAEQQPH